MNKTNFGGRPSVSCYTCHRGARKPTVIPSLAAQYGEPPAEDPDAVEAFEGARVTATADQIIDKYVQAVGGAQARRVLLVPSLSRGRTRPSSQRAKRVA